MKRKEGEEVRRGMVEGRKRKREGGRMKKERRWTREEKLLAGRK